MAFYNRWRQVRESRGITMTTACEALGISKPMLSQIETGQARTTVRVMECACQLYHCQMSDLYLYITADPSDSTPIAVG